MDAMELKRNLRIGGEISRVDSRELTYSQFVDRYLVKNQPVVLTSLMDDWRACVDWVKPNGSPNLGFFAECFGESRVQVADCGVQEFTDQKRVEMTVSEFVGHWHDSCADDSSGSSMDQCGQSLFYLKDWHFVREYPDYVAYTTPSFFEDDWLNMYLDKYQMHRSTDIQDRSDISCSDYRFVYMGPKGTWTPLHADVFRSYSWSANVCGSKLWLFLPPSQHHLVSDRNMKNSVYNILEEVNESKFPGLKKAVWTECIQGRNEIIFVPSGWYHQVHNLEDTVSINHNWFNAFNLCWVLDLLLRDYDEAREYIEDIRDICDDFEGLCQRNLAANTGMNFCDFFSFLIIMAFANLVSLYLLLGKPKVSSLDPHPQARHAIINLLSIRRVASRLKLACSTEHHGISMDFGKILKDPVFLNLCTCIQTTYQNLYGPFGSTHKTLNASLAELEDSDFFEALGSVMSTPGDLVSLVDRALAKIKVAPVGEIWPGCQMDI